MEKEALYRKQQRIYLNESSIKLGRNVLMPKGGKYVESFEEGEEIRRIKDEIFKIRRERMEIEKLKKNRNKRTTIKKDS